MRRYRKYVKILGKVTAIIFWLVHNILKIMMGK